MEIGGTEFIVGTIERETHARGNKKSGPRAPHDILIRDLLLVTVILALAVGWRVNSGQCLTPFAGQ